MKKMKIDGLMLALKRRIKNYVLSFKPIIINSDAFKYHIYYIVFNKEIQKIKQRYDISKTAMMEIVSYTVRLTMAELAHKGIYTRMKGGRDMLFCLNAGC